MKRRLVALLCCPECRGGLALEAGSSRGEEVMEGRLVCACGRTYPVARGVPRFVPGDSYVASFSLEWTIHARTQLDTPVWRESWDTFVQKTGFREEDIRGRVVLDAGCGAGRFLDVASRMGAAECVGVDLSYAVESSFRNAGERGNTHVVQADLFHLPFRPGTFDVVFSIGVLHHTPDTRQAFLGLPPLLAPGGRIAIWVYDAYAASGKVSDLYRKVTTRLPKRLLYALSAVAGPYGWLARVPLLGPVFRFLLPMSVHPDPRWRRLDTFDWYSPAYQWKHRYPEVAGWFREAGLGEIEILEPPVAVRGRRP